MPAGQSHEGIVSVDVPSSKIPWPVSSCQKKLNTFIMYVCMDVYVCQRGETERQRQRGCIGVRTHVDVRRQLAEVKLFAPFPMQDLRVELKSSVLAACTCPSLGLLGRFQSIDIYTTVTRPVLGHISDMVGSRQGRKWSLGQEANADVPRTPQFPSRAHSLGLNFSP